MNYLIFSYILLKEKQEMDTWDKSSWKYIIHNYTYINQNSIHGIALLITTFIYWHVIELFDMHLYLFFG